MSSADHLEAVLAALHTIRAQKVGSEVEYLHPLVATALNAAALPHQREAELGSGSRVDFLTYDGVVVEVKRGRPRRADLMRQLERYASHDVVNAIVLVLERSTPLPDKLCGKPVRVISLNMLWGLAV